MILNTRTQKIEPYPPQMKSLTVTLKPLPSPYTLKSSVKNEQYFLHFLGLSFDPFRSLNKLLEFMEIQILVSLSLLGVNSGDNLLVFFGGRKLAHDTLRKKRNIAI
jgi:hypothetical protein